MTLAAIILSAWLHTLTGHAPTMHAIVRGQVATCVIQVDSRGNASLNDCYRQ
jgi:hypothetical protein